MGMIGNAPYAGVIDTGNILDGAITAAKIKAAADLVAKLGYTPLNKAGDTLTGVLEGGGVVRNADNFRVGANNASTKYGLRIGASGANDPLEIWREHSNGDLCVFSVDYNGYMTTPKQPVFGGKFSGSATQAGNISPIKYDTVYANQGSHYSASTGLFTVPIAGVYLAIVQSLNNAYAGFYSMQLTMGAGVVANSWSVTDNNASPSVQSMVMLQATKTLAQGDTIYVSMVTNKTSNYMAETYNTLSIIKVA